MNAHPERSNSWFDFYEPVAVDAIELLPTECFFLSPGELAIIEKKLQRYITFMVTRGLIDHSFEECDVYVHSINDDQMMLFISWFEGSHLDHPDSRIFAWVKCESKISTCREGDFCAALPLQVSSPVKQSKIITKTDYIQTDLTGDHQFLGTEYSFNGETLCLVEPKSVSPLNLGDNRVQLSLFD